MVVGAENASIFDFSFFVSNIIFDGPMRAAQACAASPFDDVGLFDVGISDIQAHTGLANDVSPEREAAFPEIAVRVQFSNLGSLFTLNGVGAEAWAAERNSGYTDDFVV